MNIPVGFLEKENRRYNCYRLLSACYCLPSEDFYKESLMDDLIASLEGNYYEARDFAEAMKSSLENYTSKDLLIDYSKLFIGPFKLIAPPYGSVYLDEGRRVMGDSTIDVVRRYAKAGVMLDEHQKDMPDHISVELEFMSYLIYKELEALKDGDSKISVAVSILEDQEDFLKKHLGAWVPEFTKSMKEGIENSFYQNLADLTEVFVAKDILILKDSIFQLKGITVE